MTEKRSRWSDPAIIVAVLAVLNGGYWQYKAMGRADSDALAAARAVLAKQVAEDSVNIRVHETRLDDHDRQLDRLERRR